MNVDLRACLSGDKRAWDAFVRSTSRLIFAAVQRALQARTGGCPDLEDRIQDVYVRLVQDNFRLLRTFDPARASLSTWLTLVARSVVHEHLRKRALPIRQLHESASVVSQRAVEPPTADLPWHVLTERQRLVLQMLFDEGISVEQAAGRMGVDRQTIRSTKHKALCRLREEMAIGQAQGDATAVSCIQPEDP